MSEGCSGCTGLCCYDVVVHVTPFDVWRIVAAQALAPLQVVEPREATAGEIVAEAFGARIDDTPRLFCSVLRKSSLEPGACQFLMHLGDERKRCGIYPDRPRVCAVYPFVMRNGSVDLRGDARCETGDWNMARLDYALVRRQLAVYHAEWCACARIVEVWNLAVETGHRAPSFEVFVAFAHEIAGRLLSDKAADVELLERWDEALLPREVEVRRDAWLDGVTRAAQAALTAVN